MPDALLPDDTARTRLFADWLTEQRGGLLHAGCEQYRVVARLRYRITEGKLGIGYQLVRAEDVMRAAFADTLAAVEEATGLTAYRGTPGA